MSEPAVSLESPAGMPFDLRSYADQLLESVKVEYVDEGVLLVMAPAGFEHRTIVRSITRAIDRACFAGLSSVDWDVHAENFQWDLPDDTRRFYIPDLVVVPAGSRNAAEEREAIALVVEVTSPKSPDTVLNDRDTKPRQYAKAGIPLYLLVDQEHGAWVLHALADGWQRYQIAADGAYGEEINLPAPFGFPVPTGDWPRYPAGDTTSP